MTSHTVIGNKAPNCQLSRKAHNAPTVPLVLHLARIGMHDDKIQYQMPIAKQTFLLSPFTFHL